MAVFRGWLTAEGNATHLLDFLQVQGMPVAVRPQFERLTRPGVDGIGVWYTGQRGEPFQLTTVSDCVDSAAVASAFGVARAAVGLKRDLYLQNGLWGTVLIHSVDRQPVQYVRSVVGGQFIPAGNSGFLLTLNWVLESLV